LPGPGGTERCPKPDYVAYVVIVGSIIIRGLYKLTLCPSHSHSATESQSFCFSVKIISQSALGGRPENLFHRAPNPLSAALIILPLDTDIILL
jgi:hypothetical protein